ncbi:hypothetical protein OGATHE_001033 [Ogataea polymorpha]|uniref:Uncharacterized protein n=1 Tax=Ogataea polymorpha TaxID=460523 RepID=A0A9P8PSJ9_9ASCO|nr:hypothetical protein OGATHE_001033 [Ogataea polymorpha]
MMKTYRIPSAGGIVDQLLILPMSILSDLSHRVKVPAEVLLVLNPIMFAIPKIKRDTPVNNEHPTPSSKVVVTIKVSEGSRLKQSGCKDSQKLSCVKKRTPSAHFGRFVPTGKSVVDTWEIGSLKGSNEKAHSLQRTHIVDSVCS